MKTLGGRHVTMAIKNGSQLWVWGDNTYGVLGNGGSPGYGLQKKSSPVQISGAWKSDKLYAGYIHNGGIKTNDTLFMWGRNEAGNLGQNNTTNASSPIQIPGTWDMVHGTNASSIGLKTDGTLWSWGNNSRGKLGLNTPENSYMSSPTQVGTDTTWDFIHGNNYNTCFGIKTDGTLWSWGENFDGSLGLRQPTNSHKSSPTQIPGIWDASQGMGGGYFWVFGFKAV